MQTHTTLEPISPDTLSQALPLNHGRTRPAASSLEKVTIACQDPVVMLCPWNLHLELEKTCLRSESTSISSYGACIRVLSLAESPFPYLLGGNHSSPYPMERVNLRDTMPSIRSMLSHQVVKITIVILSLY